MKEAFNCASAVPPQGPYSHGNKAAGLCFASGQMPADPITGVIPEGITEQTRQVLKNIEAILRDGGCQSPIRGLYPCGEGAGYAGGIVSAAVDGIRVAEAVAQGLD